MSSPRYSASHYEDSDEDSDEASADADESDTGMDDETASIHSVASLTMMASQTQIHTRPSSPIEPAALSPGNTSVLSNNSFAGDIVPDSEDDRIRRRIKKRSTTKVVDLTSDDDGIAEGSGNGNPWNPFEGDDVHPGSGRYDPYLEGDVMF